MSIAIQVARLNKSFASQAPGRKRIQALDDVSLEVYSGEILGILGPNGAGKTTFLNILSTLLLPDKGTVEILGLKLIPKNFHRIRRLFNMSSGYPNFPWSLTVEENLRFYGRLYDLSGKKLTQKVHESIEMFGLKEYAHQRFEELSSGLKQRLALAKSFLNSPEIIFLDEPTVGLDPEAAQKTRGIILDILKSSQVTVLLTTHNMREAELLCGRIAFIRQGRILKLASPKELKFQEHKKDLEEIFIELAHERAGELTQVLDGSGGLPAPPLRRAGQEAGQAGGPPQFSSRDENWPQDERRPEKDPLKAWLNRAFAFTYRNYLFAIRNFFAFAELVFWPTVSLISIGLLGDFLELKEKALGFILTGAIAAGVLQVTQLDVAYSLLYEVWSKSMKHTFLTPVGVSENLFGSWITGMIRGFCIFVLLGLASIFLFDFEFPGWKVTGFFLLGIFGCALLLGLLVSILILLFGQKAETTAWMFAYLFMLLCGIYYPIDTLPKPFYALAQVIPLTYFLEYFRQSFGFYSEMSSLLIKGFVLILLYLILGLGAMKYAFHEARRKGVIVRLSE